MTAALPLRRWPDRGFGQPIGTMASRCLVAIMRRQMPLDQRGNGITFELTGECARRHDDSNDCPLGFASRLAGS